MPQSTNGKRLCIITGASSASETRWRGPFAAERRPPLVAGGAFGDKREALAPKSVGTPLGGSAT